MILVSIVTPSYNCSSFISGTILSVIRQTFTDWEMVIVDDCSTDNSVEVIQSFIEQDSRIRLIQLSINSGTAVARNVAIESAQGRYIAFLDSDDCWLPEKLEKQLAFMKRESIPFSFSAYEKINEVGDIIGSVGVPDRVSYQALLKTCVIGCLTVIYDTEYFGKVEMPLIRKRQDFGLWLKLLKKVDYAYGFPNPLAQYRVHSGSISANKFNTVLYTWRLYRDIEKLSLMSACYYYSHYIVRGFLRTKFPAFSRLIGVST